MRVVALLFQVVCLAGCKIDSTNPISADGDALYGVWLHKSRGKLTYVHIGPEFSLSAGSVAAAKRRVLRRAPRP